MSRENYSQELPIHYNLSTFVMNSGSLNLLGATLVEISLS
jgi:hypothetical protein